MNKLVKMFALVAVASLVAGYGCTRVTPEKVVEEKPAAEAAEKVKEEVKATPTEEKVEEKVEEKTE